MKRQTPFSKEEFSSKMTFFMTKSREFWKEIAAPEVLALFFKKELFRMVIFSQFSVIFKAPA